MCNCFVRNKPSHCFVEKCRSVLIKRQLTANKAETILVLEATPKSRWKVAVSRYVLILLILCLKMAKDKVTNLKSVKTSCSARY